MAKLKRIELLEKDERYQDQYGYIEFNKAGNMRGFGVGFKSKAFEKFIEEFAKDESIVIPFQGGYMPSNLPSKYIESYYWKTSTENDLAAIIKLMPFKF